MQSPRLYSSQNESSTFHTLSTQEIETTTGLIPPSFFENTPAPTTLSVPTLSAPPSSKKSNKMPYAHFSSSMKKTFPPHDPELNICGSICKDNVSCCKQMKNKDIGWCNMHKNNPRLHPHAFLVSVLYPFCKSPNCALAGVYKNGFCKYHAC